MSPHNFLTCCFFSRPEAETGFGLKEMGGRRGGRAAVGTTMENRERVRCGCCGCCDCCFDPAATLDLLLPAAIEAHEDDDDEYEDGFSCF